MKKSLILLAALLQSAIILFCGCQHSSDTVQRAYTAADSTLLIQLLDSTNVCLDESDYTAALALSRQCCEISEQLHDTLMWSESLSCMVVAYQSIGQTDSAILMSRQQLLLDEALGEASALATDYSNLAFIYAATGIDMDEAQEFIQKAIEYEKQVEGQPKLGIRYGIASEIYNAKGMTDEALHYIQMAYYLDSLAGNPVRMARRLSQMGDIYFKQHQFDGAQKCYEQAVPLLEAVGEHHSLGITYRQLGSLLLTEEGHREKAIVWLEKAEQLASEDQELNSLVKIYEQLGEAYQKLDPAKSNQYFRLYTAAKDSLMKEQKRQSMAEFKVQYDTDTQTALAEERSRELSSTRLYALTGIALLVAIAIWLGYLLRRRIVRNRQLREHIAQLREQMSEQREQYLSQIKQENTTQEQLNAEDQQFMDRVNAAIFDIMGKSELTTETVASRLCITSQQLRRRIQAIVGAGGSNAYISTIRTNYAKDLLLNQRQLSITEVAQLCGFDDPAHFTRSFKKETGVTPSEFRR